jgi:hypothetical protein
MYQVIGISSRVIVLATNNRETTRPLTLLEVACIVPL